MTSNDRPRYVVPTATDATAVLHRLVRAGWTAREGFALGEPAPDVSRARLVLFGPVADLSTVQQAVLAAARGAGIVAICDPASESGRALVADLRRFGPVHRDSEADPAAPPRPPISALVPEQRALLDRLANGETIASAAAAEFLSLRTANRRIARARQLLGVRTTREAVLAYLRQRGGD
ncbi:MAG TPA: LuxR family transcriptional regulator [Micromonosporaceae bacterium]